MVGLLIKLMVCPILILISAFLFQDVYYPAFYQPLFVGLVLAVISHMIEVYVLMGKTFWMTLALDFLLASLLVFVSAFFFPNAHVTWIGAALTGFLLTIPEYFQHHWLTNEKIPPPN